MSSINQDKLIEELNKKWHGNGCPMCGNASWVVSDKVFELREFNNGDFIVGNVPIVPIVTVSCDNCGNTVLVNPLVLGIMKNND